MEGGVKEKRTKHDGQLAPWRRARGIPAGALPSGRARGRSAQRAERRAQSAEGAPVVPASGRTSERLARKGGEGAQATAGWSYCAREECLVSLGLVPNRHNANGSTSRTGERYQPRRGAQRRERSFQQVFAVLGPGPEPGQNQEPASSTPLPGTSQTYSPDEQPASGDRAS